MTGDSLRVDSGWTEEGRRLVWHLKTFGSGVDGYSSGATCLVKRGGGR